VRDARRDEVEGCVSERRACARADLVHCNLLLRLSGGKGQYRQAMQGPSRHTRGSRLQRTITNLEFN
jgi:hypothetical protein